MKYILMMLVLACTVSLCQAYNWDTYDVDDFEEDAGMGSSIELNPSEGIYGLSFGDGTWLTGTPVFGDFFVTLFHNDIEEAFYSGVGLTLRIMPHWEIAPFVGAGGSYNLSLSGGDDVDEFDGFDDEELGESYWGGHAECGIRLWTDEQFVEFSSRYTWSSTDVEEGDYWLARFSYGIRAW